MARWRCWRPWRRARRPASAPARFGAGPGRFRAAAGYYPGCAQLASRGGWRPYAPLLVLAGGVDDWTPPGPCVAMLERARAAGAPAEIVVYATAYHGFDHPNLPVRTRIARNNDWRQPERRVHLGSDPVARAASIVKLQAFLQSSFAD